MLSELDDDEEGADDLGFLFGDGKGSGPSRGKLGGEGGPLWGIDPFSDN